MKYQFSVERTCRLYGTRRLVLNALVWLWTVIGWVWFWGWSVVKNVCCWTACIYIFEDCFYLVELNRLLSLFFCLFIVIDFQGCDCFYLVGCLLIRILSLFRAWMLMFIWTIPISRTDPNPEKWVGNTMNVLFYVWLCLFYFIFSENLLLFIFFFNFWLCVSEWS